MSGGSESLGSFFPSSQAIVTGGTFTIHNTHNTTHVYGPERGGYERLLDAVAPNALYNSGHVVDPPKCHPGTRVAIIQTILDWIAGSEEGTRDKYFTWLTGAAGAGKSAIGRSVCELCAKEGTLLASFFFGSSDATRNHARLLVATITYQICAIIPGVRGAVSAVIDHDPLIFTRSLATQFQSLVIEPLATDSVNRCSRIPTLIVLDGLDECSEKDFQCDILEAILHLVTSSPIPLRILVGSRPESHIKSTFSAVKMNSKVFKIFLGDEYLPNDDIRLYFRDQFQDIHESHIFKESIPPSWPNDQHLSELVYRSSGQFVYASTVVRYVRSSRHRPHQRLDAILGLRPPFKDLPFSELDALYTYLLTSSEEPSIAIDIMAFLAIYETMVPGDIDQFLGLEAGQAEIVLSELAAIVEIKSSTEDEACQAFLLHKSFRDFLFDSHRSKHLSKNFADCRVQHISRLIEIFSGGPVKYLTYSFSFHYWQILRIDDISYESLSQSARLRIMKSSGEFPMESYCADLLSDGIANWKKLNFLSSFFEFLFTLKEKESLKEIWNSHVHAFCNCVLSEFHKNHSHDWEMNLIFTATQLEHPSRYLTFNISCFGTTLQEIKLPVPFQQLLNEAEASRIMSKAAARCLEYLCDASQTKKEARNHLQMRCIDRRKRKTCPWMWKRRSRRDPSSIRVIVARYQGFQRPKRLSISTRGKLPARLTQDQIFSVHSFEWTLCKLSPMAELIVWHRYMVLLEYVANLLPRAGKFLPLIQLCKRKCFAPFSMMFPNDSRRARRAIAKYLARMDSEVAMEVDD